MGIAEGFNMKTFLVPLAALALAICGRAEAALIWDGPTITFARPNGADWTLPANQDRLTDNVWITRATTQGLFNIKQEAGFTHDFSPADTQWASGAAANWPSLTFTDWEGWTDTLGGPPSMVGVNAVMHLISDDIYVDVRFVFWQGPPGEGGGGGFTYERSTAPVPEPATASLLAIGSLALAARALKRRKVR